MCLSERNNTPHDWLGRQVSNLTNLGLEKVLDTCDYLSFEEASEITSEDHELTAIQLNVRGLISKSNDLSKLITGCLKKHKVDLVLLCETWLTPDVKSLVSIPGYNFHGIEHCDKKEGGVGLLIAEELHYKNRQDLNVFNTNFECFIELFSKGPNIVCGAGYRPPNTNIKDFQADFNKCMFKIKLETHKDVIIGMDHNLDFVKADTHEKTETFVNSLLEQSLFPCISRPTRITNTTATLIDNIFVSSHLHENQKSCIILHDISDHFPSLIQIEDVWTKKWESKIFLSRNINQCKMNALKSSLRSIDWSIISTVDDVNQCYTLFINTLTEPMDHHICS